MELFKIFGTIALNGMDEFNKNIDSASEKGSSLGTKIASGLQTMAKVGGAAITAASAAVGALTKTSVQNYAEYEQLVGGVETLFKDSSDTVMNYANNAYQSAGLSANDYMSTVTSFSASLLQGLGGDTEAAAEMANVAITDMSDNANKMGTDMASIQNAYQGFAKQNYTLLDNLKLGYGGTAAEMARLINDSGVLGKSIKVTADTVNRVSFDKIIEAIHVVQTNMGITGTTAAEAASTISGSVAMMKAAWANLTVGVADDTQNMSVLVSNFVESASIAAGNLLPRIETALLGIGELATQMSPVLTSAVSSLVSNVLPQLVSAGVSMVSSLLSGFQANAWTLSPGMVASVSTIITGIVGLIPQFISTGASLISALMMAIAASIPELVTTVTEIVPQISTALIDAMPELLEAAITMFMAIVEAIPSVVSSLATALPQIITAIVSTLSSNVDGVTTAAVGLLTAIADAIPMILPVVIAAIPQIITGISDALAGSVPQISEAAVKAFMALVDAVPQIVQALREAMPQLLSAVLDAINNIGSSIAEQVPSMSGAFENLASVVTGAAAAFAAYKTASAISGVISALTKATEGQTIAQTLLNAVMNANPFVLIATLVAGLVAAIITLWNTNEGFRDTVIAVWEAIKGAFVSAWEAIQGAWSACGEFFSEIWNSIKETFSDALDVGKKIIDDIKQGIADAWQGLVDWFKGIWDSLFGGLSVNVSANGNGSGSGVDGSHASGLNYVPYNGYIAELHKGEMVVPAEEAAALRSGAGSADLVTVMYQVLGAINDMNANMGTNMKKAISGATIGVNHREFGRLVRTVT